MIKAGLLCSCVVLFLSVSLDAQAGDIIFEQKPWTDVGTGQVSSVDSLFGGQGAQVWDDFTLSSSWTITQIDWWGFNQYPATGTPSFSLTLYSDDGSIDGAPGTPVYSGSGLNIPGVSDPAVFGGLVYSYSTTLTDPFAADAGTYWLSIYNESTALTWGWQVADPDPAINPSYDVDGAIQTYLGDEGWTSHVNDVAFQIVGTTTSVPEPSLVLLLGLGIGSACLIGWRFGH